MFLQVLIFYHIIENLQYHISAHIQYVYKYLTVIPCRTDLQSCCRLFLNIRGKKLKVILTFYTRHSVTYLNTAQVNLFDLSERNKNTWQTVLQYFPVCTNEVIVHGNFLIILFYLFFLLWALLAVHTMQFSLPPSLIISDLHYKEISIDVFPERDLRQFPHSRVVER
jgi:hypothetical protein